jgi:hypothetical protein
MSNLDEFAWFMGPRERAHDITNSKTTGFPCWAPLLGLCGSRERESKTALLSQPYCFLRSIAWYVSVSTELSSAYISCHSEDWDYLLTRSGFQARPIGIQYLESNRPLLGILSYEIQRKVFHPLFWKDHWLFRIILGIGSRSLMVRGRNGRSRVWNQHVISALRILSDNLDCYMVGWSKFITKITQNVVMDWIFKLEAQIADTRNREMYL